ncbi:MAG: hypothetical protein LBT43_01305 [Prevotella sp.]|jgi:hypothetical protein|nr:hypothetical protein [Prevotella sp.]
MKYPIPLKAVFNRQAQREYLKTYVGIELLERGKPWERRGLVPYEAVVGKCER